MAASQRQLAHMAGLFDGGNAIIIDQFLHCRLDYLCAELPVLTKTRDSLSEMCGPEKQWRTRVPRRIKT